jgi:hypothetical protein
MLTLHRDRLEKSGVNVINLLDPARRQGLVDPHQFHSARFTGRQQIIEPDIEISSLSFSATFKFGATQETLVCVSSRDIKRQVPFYRALLNRRSPVLQFVSVTEPPAKYRK